MAHGLEISDAWREVGNYCGAVEYRRCTSYNFPEIKQNNNKKEFYMLGFFTTFQANKKPLPLLNMSQNTVAEVKEGLFYN